MTIFQVILNAIRRRRHYDEYESDIFLYELYDDLPLSFEAWYHEKYCVKKQPKQLMPESVYR